MLDEETIARERKLLATYRSTVRHLVMQAAQYGGEAFVPPHVIHRLNNAREQISRIKGVLRANGLPVDDHPDDEAPSARGVAPKTGGMQVGGDHAGGDIDKRQGVFVSGGTIIGPVIGVNSGSVTIDSSEPDRNAEGEAG